MKSSVGAVHTAACASVILLTIAGCREKTAEQPPPTPATSASVLRGPHAPAVISEEDMIELREAVYCLKDMKGACTASMGREKEEYFLEFEFDAKQTGKPVIDDLLRHLIGTYGVAADTNPAVPRPGQGWLKTFVVIRNFPGARTLPSRWAGGEPEVELARISLEFFATKEEIEESWPWAPDGAPNGPPRERVLRLHWEKGRSTRYLDFGALGAPRRSKDEGWLLSDIPLSTPFKSTGK